MSVIEDRPAARTGRTLARVDGPEKVTGEARYAYEHTPGDVAYGALVTSPIARGRVARVDATPALALTGRWPSSGTPMPRGCPAATTWNSPSCSRRTSPTTARSSLSSWRRLSRRRSRALRW